MMKPTSATRRRSLATPLALLVLAWIPAAVRGATEDEERMNILVLTIDDMNCDSVGAFGCSTPDTTPNMDRFAEQAMRFMHAHVHTTSCIPSRNIVQSGRYLYNSGIEGFYELPEEQVTFATTPDILRDNGYFTIIRGKSDHSSPYEPYPAWDLNFDSELEQRRRNPRQTKSFYQYTKRGIEAAKAAGKPFYFSMDIHDPHTPLYSFSHKKGESSTRPTRYDIQNRPSRVFSADEITMPKFLPDTQLARKEVTAYYNSVRRGDDSFGYVMQALKDTGVYENTLIIFFSDHGMPFPFAKTSLYYHSTHTPLMVHWPGVTEGGATDGEHLIGTVDILPTLLEALGIENPAGLDGRSFASILHGEAQDDRDFVYLMYEENAGGHRQPARAISSRDHSYICNLWSDGERVFETVTTGMATTQELERLAEEGHEHSMQRLELYTHNVPEQFFDLQRDPDALHNLIDDPEHAELIDGYREQMVKAMQASGDPMLSIYRNRHDTEAVAAYLDRLDSESKERMAGTAYLRTGKQRAGAARNTDDD
ncbi:MAG: N-sulfoglucosamine sulfohydrolase [Chlamydiales bacterium]|jgi:N-sulfoglucosamine sulfohydrolase